MDSKIILYTIGCPKCKVLEMKLSKSGLTYDTCTDIEIMKAKGIKTAPCLQVNEEIMDFGAAVKYINSNNSNVHQ